MVKALAIVAGLLVGAAAAAMPVGWIESFEGEAEQYQILRDGQRVPVEIFTILLEGDQVVVMSPAGRIRLALGDGSLVEEVRSGSGGYIVRPAHAPTLPINMMRWAGRWFTSWHRSQQNGIVPVYVRKGSSSPILLPPLRDIPDRLQAGVRPLFLAWHGGHAPYRVSLVRAGVNGFILSVDNVRELRLRSEPLSLSPGSHILTVEDANGRQARAKLLVVSNDELPAAPDELTRSGLAPAARVTLFAAWLASREDQRWVFEAYQQASAVATTGSAAELLRNSLERGERPHPPE
jgi:hypothetical protein